MAQLSADVLSVIVNRLCEFVSDSSIPDKTDHNYNLRPRSHSFSLTVKTDDRNYINRMLFRHLLACLYCMVAFCQSVLFFLLKREREMR